MNILEAFIKKYSQLIILILGLPCSNKSKIAKELHDDLKLTDDLKLQILNINDYLIEGKYNEMIFDDVKFNVYENSDNYDWKKLNDDVEKYKHTGLILYGNYIDSNKINFNFDFSFFYSINNNLCKKILIEKKLLNLNQIKYEKIYFEKIFNPLYDDLKKNIKFNKFFNIKEQTLFDEIYDETFDFLMKQIDLKLK
jgi:hypothetical protein